MKGIVWLVGLGVVGFVAYEYFKGQKTVQAAVNSVIPSTSSTNATQPPGYTPAYNTPQTPVPGGGQLSCQPGSVLGADAHGAPACLPMTMNNGIDPGFTDNSPNTQFPLNPAATQSPALPAGAVPGTESFYTTTSTGCPAFYSLADRSKCTKTPKAKKCQGTKLFDMCHAGWKTPAAAQRIIAKIAGA